MTYKSSWWRWINYLFYHVLLCNEHRRIIMRRFCVVFSGHVNLLFSNPSWETGMVWWHSSDYLSSVGKWKLQKRQLSFFRDVYRQNRMLLVLTQLTQPPWFLYAIAHACFYTSKKMCAHKIEHNRDLVMRET